MKINYNTLPALSILANRDFQKIKYHRAAKDRSEINSFIKNRFCARFDDAKKYVLSGPFNKAFESAQNKFADYNLFCEIETQSVVIIRSKFVDFINIENNDGRMPSFEFLSFFDDNFCGCTELTLHSSSEGNNMKFITGFSKTIVDIDKDPVAAPESVMFNDLCLLLFLKYANVETKILPPKAKSKLFACNYSNDTKQLFTILDSTWYTTLVKSDGFNVRGHWRLQPKKKEGEWTKEIIWINEFRKDGYTSPARKLNFEPWK